MARKLNKQMGRMARKSTLASAATGSAVTDPIVHVIVLMFENRSFDHLLGGLKSMFPDLDGIDRAHPGVNRNRIDTYNQESKATDRICHDPYHETSDTLIQINTNGQCGGFAINYEQHYPDADAQVVMDYFKVDNLSALHTMAKFFTICDQWHSSVPGPTWTNRFFVHSGTSIGRVLMPDSFFHLNMHLYDQTTVYDRLNERKISWKIYFGDFPQSLVLTHQWWPPNAARYHGMDSFFEDARGDEKDFPQYSFIEPSYFGDDQNDQHPPTNIQKGDALLARIYNAIRANEQLWLKTLFVVLYDEHGGFYDHVYPPPAVPPDKYHQEYTFDQLGLRVPALLVSPWVERTIIHDTFDHTSLLRYVSDKWTLGKLRKRTAVAKSFDAALQKLDAPRTDTPQSLSITKAPKARARALGVPAARSLNDHQKALLAFSQVLENQTVEPQRLKVARSLKMVESPEDHVAVAMDRLNRFLAQQKRQARGTRR